jgi:hypothetical protein
MHIIVILTIKCNTDKTKHCFDITQGTSYAINTLPLLKRTGMSTTKFQELNATGLAQMLDYLQVESQGTRSTGALSQLNEALADWARQHPSLEPLRDRFNQAYSGVHRIQDRLAWDILLRAATAFSEELRKLGSAEIKRCQAPGRPQGVCGGGLNPDGSCPFPENHR